MGAVHISLAEIMIVRELLSRDSLDDATKSTLLQQVLDQKIEGVLRAERQRATWELESEREALASQHKSNVCIVQQRLQAALEEARQLRETVTAERAQAAAARAQQALVLYASGEREEALRVARQVVTRTPGFTDLHVMLAADAWSRGDRQKAMGEWDFACEAISSGCKSYRDMVWLRETRRWPSELVAKQLAFLEEAKPPLGLLRR